MTDVSIKEEDREVDIESYSDSDAAKPVVEEAVAEEELPVDVDKVYEEE
jgi:small subunit ribosomal protein S2